MRLIIGSDDRKRYPECVKLYLRRETGNALLRDSLAAMSRLKFSQIFTPLNINDTTIEPYERLSLLEFEIISCVMCNDIMFIEQGGKNILNAQGKSHRFFFSSVSIFYLPPVRVFFQSVCPLNQIIIYCFAKNGTLIRWNNLINTVKTVGVWYKYAFILANISLYRIVRQTMSWVAFIIKFHILI